MRETIFSKIAREIAIEKLASVKSETEKSISTGDDLAVTMLGRLKGKRDKVHEQRFEDKPGQLERFMDADNRIHEMYKKNLSNERKIKGSVSDERKAALRAAAYGQ